MIKIGGVTVKPGRPALAGVVADLDWEKAEWKSADILEVRLDRLFGLPAGKGVRPEVKEAGSFIRDLKKKTGKPLLLTIRRPEESDVPGSASLADRDRLPFFEALIPLADAVDVEVDSAIARAVVRAAAGRKKPVIGSHHNFRRLPPDKTLYEKLGRAGNLGADVFKFAGVTDSPKEAVRLLLFCNLFSGSRLVCGVGMGKKSGLCRIAAPLFGSVLCYGALSARTALGQQAIGELRADFRRYYP